MSTSLMTAVPPKIYEGLESEGRTGLIPHVPRWLNFQAHVLKGASGAVSAWGKGVDWLLTKAQKEPKKSRRKKGQAANDFLDSSSGDDTAGPASSTGSQPTWTSGTPHGDPGYFVPYPEPSDRPGLSLAGEAAIPQPRPGSQKAEVGYARAYTSRWSTQMDAQARDSAEQATASGRVVKRVNDKKHAVDRAVGQKLDERCRQVADDLLRGGSPGELNLGLNAREGQPMQATISEVGGGQAQVTFLPDGVQVQHLPAPA